MEGLGSLTGAAGNNIMMLKKAINTQEQMMDGILEGAGAQNLQSPESPSAGAKAAAAETQKKGVSLDISA